MTEKNDQLPWDAPPKVDAFAMLEKLTKITVAVLAVAYGLGLLVANQYLLSIGYSNFSAVKPKYIITGLWTMALIVVNSLPMVRLLFSLHYNRGFITNILLFLITLAGAATSDFGILYFFEFRTLNGGVVAALAGFIEFLFVTWIGVGIVWYSLRVLNADIPERILSYGMFFGINACLTLVYLTHLTSKNFYNRVPEALGGGKAFAARVILNDKGAEFWKQAGVSQGTDSPGVALTSRVTVLYQDEKTIILDVSNTTAKGDKTGDKPKRMILNKDMVSGVVIEE